MINLFKSQKVNSEILESVWNKNLKVRKENDWEKLKGKLLIKISMKKVAFITGITGQDGAYLAEFLLSKNYQVLGADRRTSGPSLWRLEKLGIANEIEIVDCDLLEFSNLERIFKKYKISEIYNLAAQSFVASSFNTPIYTSKVNSLGVLSLLELIRNNDREIKFYQASTSEMLGI